MSGNLQPARDFPVDDEGYPVTIEGLQRQHPRWLVRERVFADGRQYEARRKGTTERVVRSTCPQLSRAMDVATVSARRAWAVGQDSDSDGKTLAERWNGTRWRVVATRNHGDGARFLRSVAAPSPRQAFAVGSYHQQHGRRTHDLAERWIRSRWFRSVTPNPGGNFNSLQGVAARSTTRVWAVGTTRADPQQRFLTLAEHWNGTRWLAARTPSPGSGDDGLSGIAEIPHRGGFWAVGTAGDTTLIESHC